MKSRPFLLISARIAGPRRVTSPVGSWLIVASVYFLAVFHRSSLGVAGLLAERRFGISAAELSVFVLLQIGVYAALQIPTGVLVDRYGPRRLLVIAAALMGIGQLLFAVAPSYPLALLARALLGAGDAMTFISVLRFAARQFGPRRYPLVVALTGMAGMAGNLLATLPLTVLLGAAGWGPSYAMAAGLSLVGGVVVWVLIDDRVPPRDPVRGAAQIRAGVATVAHRIRTAWGLPGTRLGFWVHFACMSTGTSFAVLWGVPYLQQGAGFSAAGAGAVLMAGVIGSALVSPLFGAVIGRRPAWRVPIAIGVCALTVLGWVVVSLGLGDHPAHAVVAPLFVLSMFGGPTSMAAFALARDYNQPGILGTASGVVNVGGFVATVIVAVGFGWVLDLQGGTSAHTMRHALLVAAAVQTLGTVRVIVWFRRVRARVREQQTVGRPVPVRVGAARWWDLPSAGLDDAELAGRAIHDVVDGSVDRFVDGPVDERLPRTSAQSLT